MIRSRSGRMHRGTQPPYDAPAYGSTHKRHPQETLVRLPHTITEISGPRFAAAQFPPIPDLSVVDGKAALGERIIVHGRITDEDGRPIPQHDCRDLAGQCVRPLPASGRPARRADSIRIFAARAACYTDGDGWYRFTSIKPGAYPWRNHHNAWRPNHVHFSFFGSGFAQRLVTQMYFPATRCSSSTRCSCRSPDEGARNRLDLQARHDGHRARMRRWAIAWDVVLRGREATPMES